MIASYDVIIYFIVCVITIFHLYLPKSTYTVSRIEINIEMKSDELWVIYYNYTTIIIIIYES